MMPRNSYWPCLLPLLCLFFEFSYIYFFRFFFCLKVFCQSLLLHQVMLLVIILGMSHTVNSPFFFKWRYCNNHLYCKYTFGEVIPHYFFLTLKNRKNTHRFCSDKIAAFIGVGFFVEGFSDAKIATSVPTAVLEKAFRVALFLIVLGTFLSK